MYVLATAGHVDHGKSTLVRALTGMEPDRWAQERRRGMTIDLGFAWTTLDTGQTVAFVDVPGHSRFIGNMLAGLGPAPVVMFVVAADEGWRAQSTEHLAAVDALGISRGILVVTRSDLADPAAVMGDASRRIAETSLGLLPAVSVSAVTGAGLRELRAALGGLTGALPAPRLDGRVRLWVDRSFTIRGSGTVVTGTLTEGRLAVGDTLDLDGESVVLRGVQTLGEPVSTVAAVARVAINLRSVPRESVGRGAALLTPGRWRRTGTVDVTLGVAAADLPTRLTMHVGTAAVPVRVRPLLGGSARLILERELPLEPGDRAVLRDPGRRVVAAGATVVDIDPPTLRRRGSARRRGQDLERNAELDPVVEVQRRGAVRRADLLALGITESALAGERELSVLHAVGDWLIAPDRWQRWHTELLTAVDRRASTIPLNPGLPVEEARRLLEVPAAVVVTALATDAELECVHGRLQRRGTAPTLGAAESSLAAIEVDLRSHPFRAPEANDLAAAGLGTPELAAAAGMGRIVRLADDVVLLPTAPALAMRILAELPQPFTTSDARVALGTTRRVAIPLLEYLDSRRWTRRVDSGHREVVR